MADIYVTEPDAFTSNDAPLKEKYHDNGDGTYSEVVYTGGGAGTAAAQNLGAYQTVVLQNAAVAVGNGTTIALSGMAAMSLSVTGTFVGTIAFEIQDPSGAWVPVLLQSMGSTTLASSTSTTGVWRAPIGGYGAFRARVSAWTSGSITVTAFAENTDYTPAIQNVGMYETLDSNNDAVSSWEKGWNLTKVTASGVVFTGSCLVGGYLVAASGSGVVTLYDNTAGSGETLGANSAAVTANTNVFYGKPVIANTGVYFTLVSGTATVYVLTRGISK